jgi:hypothetical protein
MGTDDAPEAVNRLYDGMIQAFEEAVRVVCEGN